MAVRDIRIYGDEILTKPCREVKTITPRLKELANDMLDTMYEANGVGLAAPQVGVLRQIVVVDVGEEEDPNGPYVLVNPRILEKEGTQTADEGCLSVPGKAGTVTRPMKVKVKAFDIDMNEFVLEAEGLLARAVCHEIDHLSGVMYVDLVEGTLHDVEYEDE